MEPELKLGADGLVGGAEMAAALATAVTGRPFVAVVFAAASNSATLRCT